MVPGHPENEIRRLVRLSTVTVAGMVVPALVEVRATQTVTVQSFEVAASDWPVEAADALEVSSPRTRATTETAPTAVRACLRSRNTFIVPPLIFGNIRRPHFIPVTKVLIFTADAPKLLTPSRKV
jgi:hypothetical protein